MEEESCWVRSFKALLGFGAPYFDTFLGTCYLKGSHSGIKVYTVFSLVTSSPI